MSSAAPMQCSAYLLRCHEEVLLGWYLDTPVKVERPRVQLLIPGRTKSLESDDVASLLTTHKRKHGGRQAGRQVAKRMAI